MDFMGKRKYFIGASLILLLASVVGFFKPGPNYGTDFTGGTELEVLVGDGVEAGTIRSTVEKLGFDGPEVVSVQNRAGRNQYIIRVKEVSSLSDEQKAQIGDALCLTGEDGSPPKRDDCPEALHTKEVKFSPGGDKVSARYVNEVCGPPRAAVPAKDGEPAKPAVPCPPRADIAERLTGKVAGVELRQEDNNPFVENPRDSRVEFKLKSKADQIMDGLKAELGEDKVPGTPLRAEWVGPKAGKQLRDAAIISLSIAMIFIMVYIAFRFDMRFAPGAIIALLHDVSIGAGAIIVTQREFTLSTVAALLTIIGYSVNDTVAIYDRVRENLGSHRKMSFPDIINLSITQMFGRTLRTASTATVAILPFLFWGTGVIRDFAFTLLVGGLIVGTYSSIYIAAPITELIDRWFFAKRAQKAKRRVTRPRKAQSEAGAAA
jgi:preprotein translocase subunit SecF